jgi:hypothetical protein
MGTAEIITVFAVVATNLTTVLILYGQTDRKIDAIHAEIKDFHGRLCAIEERRREEK